MSTSSSGSSSLGFSASFYSSAGPAPAAPPAGAAPPDGIEASWLDPSLIRSGNDFPSNLLIIVSRESLSDVTPESLRSFSTSAFAIMTKNTMLVNWRKEDGVN